MMSGRGTGIPFTASQWQELEHQALIFKYMASGMPIPPDLLFAIKRSGWSCFQMGLGRKVDPEPGRCRRTDGKKWRCSKDAFPDSKYCERHMHRGKNRSRKPVESPAITHPITPIPVSNPPPTRTLINPNSSSTPSSHSLSPLSPISYGTHSHHHHQNPCQSQFNNAHLPSHFLYPHSSRPGHFGNGIELPPPQDNADPVYRYIHGEDPRTMRRFSSSLVVDDPLQLTPLTMSSSYSGLSSSSVSEQSGRADYYSNDYLQLQSLTDSTKQQQEEEEEEQEKMGIHHFFDEWEPKTRDSSWPNTQLSISIPNSSHGFPMFNSRPHNDGLSLE